jgi:hypothetical protein
VADHATDQGNVGGEGGVVQTPVLQGGDKKEGIEKRNKQGFRETVDHVSSFSLLQTEKFSRKLPTHLQVVQSGVPVPVAERKVERHLHPMALRL